MSPLARRSALFEVNALRIQYRTPLVPLFAPLFGAVFSAPVETLAVFTLSLSLVHTVEYEYVREFTHVRVDETMRIIDQ